MRPSLSVRGYWARVVRGGGLVVATTLMLLLGAAVSVALTIPVNAPDGTQVGSINVGVSSDGTGVVGGFTSTYPTEAESSLEAAAEKCGEHHFNWFQVVVEDNDPPNGPDGEPMEPPYIDPPLGGYQNQWGDRLPWYWDEGDDPDPRPEGFEDGYNLEDNLEDSNGDGAKDTLGFQDFPYGPPPTHVEFMTWLVSCNEDGSLHSFHGGFAWTYTNLGEEMAGLLEAGRDIFPMGVGKSFVHGPLAEGDAYPMHDMLTQPPLIPGDANHDGMVTDKDASILASHWQKCGVVWEQGDFNGDGCVTDQDASILASHWQFGVMEGQSVPEPTSGILLASMLLSLWGLRWRRGN